MSIEYKWEIEVEKITPYNVKSKQQNVVDTLRYSLTAEEFGKKASMGGAVSFDTALGVDTSTFKDISEVNDTELQNWIEARVGSDKVTQMKKELEENLKRLPDGFNPINE